MLRKILEALIALPRFGRRRCDKLIMTLLVKNEEEMLEHNLKFHRMMGVDGFIVTDNNSTDGTLAILERYKAMGWVLEIIREPGTNYLQKQWVDRMVNIARRRYHADWVINADADEFWYHESRNLKDVLQRLRANAAHCETRSLYPVEGSSFTQWTERVEFVPDQAARGLSLYSIFDRQRGKVAHRADGYLQIAMGNHKVAMLPRWRCECPIFIYHYSVKGREAFIAKMENGGRQFEQHPQKKHGRHWRYFYELYKQGRLSEEYDRVIGADQYDALKREGYIVPDDTMARIFEQLSAD